MKPEDFAIAENFDEDYSALRHETVVDRARDVHMAATINPKNRTILMTGAIDQNDQNLSAKIQLPEPGIWTFYKAETNLTNESWIMWQILLGDDFRIPDDPTARFAESRQFRQVKHREDINSIMFYDGEVRPGEPVLKAFSVEIGDTKEKTFSIGMMSHSRLASNIDDDSLKSLIDSGILDHDTTIEVDIVTNILS